MKSVENFRMYSSIINRFSYSLIQSFVYVHNQFSVKTIRLCVESGFTSSNFAKPSVLSAGGNRE